MKTLIICLIATLAILGKISFFLQAAVIIAWLAQYLSPLAAFLLWGLCGLFKVAYEVYLIMCDLHGVEVKK